ncbi:MAG: hypothetical protein GY830_02225 [Bacteroidetes bacterium]|nr:hypothetical protein [Bacteroidota bacterium]
MIFLDHANNLIGKKILTTFNASLNLTNEQNTFIFNTYLNNETLKESEINTIIAKLDKLFQTTQIIISRQVHTNKSAKFFFITTNSRLHNITDFKYAPIYDEAVHSFVKSMSKEFNAFNLNFNAICLDPIAEMLTKPEKRTYGLNMRNIVTKKTPTKLDELMLLLKELITAKTSLLSGTVFTVGAGSI